MGNFFFSPFEILKSIGLMSYVFPSVAHTGSAFIEHCCEHRHSGRLSAFNLQTVPDEQANSLHGSIINSMS